MIECVMLRYHMTVVQHLPNVVIDRAELPFFARKSSLISKMFLKISRSLATPWNRTSVGVARSRRLDSEEQVKSYAASAKGNTRGKKRGRRPNFSPAPHHFNAWNMQASSRHCILVVSHFSGFQLWVRFSGVFIQRFVYRWWLEMLYQPFFPVFPLGKVIVVQEGSVTKRFWKFTAINAINPHHDHRRVAHLCTSVQCHLQFTAAELAWKIIVWHNS